MKWIALIIILFLGSCYYTPYGPMTPFGIWKDGKFQDPEKIEQEENAEITITVIWPWDEENQRRIIWE